MIKASLVLIALAAASMPIFASAQEGSPTEVDQRLSLMEKEFLATYEAKVTSPFATQVADLNTKYVTALDRALEAATKAGKLDEALMLRDEKKFVASEKGIPNADEANAPASLKQMRATYRSEMGKLQADRDLADGTLLAKHDAMLEAYQTLLTTENKLDDALKVREARRTIAATARAQRPEPEKAPDAVVATVPMKPGEAAAVPAAARIPNALLYLPMDGPAEGQLAKQVVIHGNPLKTPAPAGIGLSFDGVDDFVDLGAIDLPDSWTLSFWGRIERVRTHDKFFKFANGLKVDQIEAQIENNGQLTFWAKNGFRMRMDPLRGVWRHYALRVDERDITLFLDGEAVESFRAESPIPVRRRDFCFLGAGSNDSGTPEEEEYLKGAMDELLLIDRCLTNLEIKDLAAPSSDPGPSAGRTAVNPSASEMDGTK